MPNTTNFNWVTPADSDLVKDGAAAIRTLGNGIDTSFVDLKGGTSGQILSKNSNTDLDFVWIANDQGDITAVTAGTGISGGGTSGAVTITNSMATEITASGDIIVGTGSGTFDNLPIGSTGQVLTADTTVSPYKVKWAAPAGGGKLLQLVQGSTATEVAVFTNTYTDSGLTATITPTSASSKVLVCVTQFIYIYKNTTPPAQGDIRLMRGATAIGDFASALSAGYLNAALNSTIVEATLWVAINYLDTPATTSATTYKTQIRTAGGQINSQLGSVRSTITLMEIGA